VRPHAQKQQTVATPATPGSIVNYSASDDEASDAFEQDTPNRAVPPAVERTWVKDDSENQDPALAAEKGDKPALTSSTNGNNGQKNSLQKNKGT
jgi:hypothetical protein